MMRLKLGTIVAIFHDELKLGRYRYVYDLPEGI